MNVRLSAICLLAVLVIAGCGSDTPDSDGSQAAGEAPSQAPATETRSADPCAPLDRSPVAYDPRGKPMAFGFEYPSGWEIREDFFPGSVSSIDVSLTLDPDGNLPDFVLRIGHALDRPNDGAEALLALWNNTPTVETVEELPLGDRRLFIARTRLAEMVSYQALFPVPDQAGSAWLITAGITRAPDECSEAAQQAVERMLRSLTPNDTIAGHAGGP